VTPTRILAALALAATCAAPAAADTALANKNGCTACHAAAQKMIGPAFQEIAKKYQGDKDAIAKLTESIRKGGSGRWGQVPMPAQPQLSEGDAKKLAAWVLAGGK
jgi:cytochrome c